ncbi:uncharacterized protein [Aegilops tauschii subsp. strangulata]|uniref:uncharacterized protein n=1 Tax=Aegilops tauschii subsp. strangulata TaxID=200361 RepID=UPI003CC8C4B9
MLVVKLKGVTLTEERCQRRFMYEEAWQQEESYDAAVLHGWRKGAGSQGLQGIEQALSDMQVHLTDWKTKKFGDVKRKIRKVRKEYEKERSNSLFRGPTRKEKDLARQLSELLHKEEILARQRSRADWLKAGDRNTGFFQACAAACKSINRIRSLQTADGEICETKEEIHAEVQQFYTGLYTAQEFTDVEAVLHHVPHKITEPMNERLMRPFREEEVKAALFAMGPTKAPGCDGFHAGFYQRHWELIGPDVTAAVLGFLKGGHMPATVNSTVIVLIPKECN